MVRRTPVGVIGLFATFILLPTTALAQSSGIAGSVKDSTGGVLPGVSVEASSPVLIEKVRTAVTDDQGRYTIVNLNPGTYTVTFSLAGFNTSKQEAIAVTSSGTATVNAELRVGAVEETLTVSGQAPTVDTRNVAGSRVLEREVLDQLPVSRSTMTGFAAVTVGIYTSRSIQDVGGTNAENQTALAAHGSRSGDAIALWEGLSYNSMMATGAGGGAYPLYTDQGAVQEVAIDVSANKAEIAVSGVRTNLIPKEGGNTLKGSMVGSYAPGSWQSNNSSAELRAQGLVTNTKLVRIYDANPSLGGAIKQNRLWFFAAYRYWGTETGQANAFFAQDPLAWTYSPNLSRPATTKQPVWSETGRLTWQASARNKFGYFIENQDICRCSVELSALVQPEATTIQHSKPARLQIFTWSMPLSNKVLLDAGANYNLYGYNVQAIPQVAPTSIAAFELSTGVRSRAPSAAGYAFGTPTFNAPNHTYNQRFSVSYVPGSHNLKVGFQMREGYRTIENNVNGNMTDTLLNGVLQGITLFTTPFSTNVGVRADLGIFAQDQWTLKRLTVNYGGRFDYLNTYAGATNLPPTQFVGPRVFPEVRAADWKDISPRFGAAYDLFGNGQTAVKVSLGRYLAGETAGLNNAENPVLSSTNMAFRTWNGPNPPLDANGNFILNCDLTAPQANGQCGPLSVSTFGKPNVVNQWDPKLINGWFGRGSDWEFGTTVQHALTNRVSVGAGYYHRWYVNWYDASFTGQTSAAATATAGRPDVAVRNLAVTPGDYSPYCITTPVNPKLPAGGGQQLCGLYDLNPVRVGQVNNLVTFKGNYGNPNEYYDGIDLTFNARILKNGSLLSGGMNTGRLVYDNCFIVNSPQDLFDCRVVQPFQPQFKLQGVFSLPRGFQASATWQDLPGIEIDAIYNAPNAVIAPSLGRNLAAGANATASIWLIPPQTQFEPRLSQTDARIGKVLKVGRIKVQGNFDAYNLFNANNILGLNLTYGPAWLTPTQILAGRLFRGNVQIDF